MHDHRPTAAAVLAIVALALPACGQEEAAPAPAERPGTGESAADPPPSEREDARDPAGRPGAGADPEDADEAAADEPPADDPAGCAFEAPPGRLAEDTVMLELDGVPCAEGIRAARAVALGQPAGSNLVVRSAGFRCEPSTLEKGVNVTYTCSSGAGEVSFDVVWSSEGP